MPPAARTRTASSAAGGSVGDAPDRRHVRRRCAGAGSRPAAGRRDPPRPRTTSPAVARPRGPARRRPDRRRSRAARRHRPARPPGSWSSSRPITCSPSGPPSSASTRLERRGARQRRDHVRSDVRQVREHDVPALAWRSRAGGRPAANSIRSPTACATAFSRASWSASVRDVASRSGPPRRASRGGAAATASVTTTAPVPTPTSITRSGGAPAGRGAPSEPAHDLELGELDQPLRLGPRDQRARSSVANARPWNSLTPRM